MDCHRCLECSLFTLRVYSDRHLPDILLAGSYECLVSGDRTPRRPYCSSPQALCCSGVALRKAYRDLRSRISEQPLQQETMQRGLKRPGEESSLANGTATDRLALGTNHPWLPPCSRAGFGCHRARSAFLHRRMGDAGVFFRAAWASVRAPTSMKLPTTITGTSTIRRSSPF